MKPTMRRRTTLAGLLAIIGCGAKEANMTAQDQPPLQANPRVLFILSQHGEMAGKPTGTYLPELAHGLAVFDAADFVSDFASLSGGPIPLYGGEDDARSKALRADGETLARVHQSLRFDQVDPASYEAVYFVGGHGTMWDFPDQSALAHVAETIYESGGVVSAVCHGPAGLVGLRQTGGRPLVEGRRVAAFTNEEERAVGHEDDVPFLLETRLRELGGVIVAKPAWEQNVVVDGRLVTGQNPASAAGVAEAVVRLVGEASSRRDAV